MTDADKRQAAASEATQAGRGVIYIAAAKLYFMIAGAVIEFRLPAIVSTAVFGAYGVVVSVVSPINNVLITGSIQAVSRFTAQKSEKARAIQAAGLRMHLFVGLPVAIAFIAMSPLFAYLLRDMEKTGLFMLAGLIIAAYSFYAVFVGTANGKREFHKQAGLDITMATMRAAAILGMFSVGLGVAGAISGWVAAAGAILVIATFVVGTPWGANRPDERYPLRPLLGFFASVAVYLILLNLIMVVDTFLLKRLSTDWFIEQAAPPLELYGRYLPDWLLAGVGELDATKAADGQVGYYRAVQNLARLSYQAIIAATFVIFPLVSRSTFDDDEGATRRYITTTCRYSTIFAMAIGVVMAANPLEVLDIPYDTAYARTGAPALIALALGSVAFALFAIAGTILNGAGLTRQAIITAAVTLVCAIAGNAIAIPLTTPGAEMLLACGVATGGSMVIGAALGGYFLRRYLGAFMPALTVIRLLIAVAVTVAAGRFLALSGALMTLVEAALMAGIFLAVLVITGELGLRDLRGILGVLRGRKKSNKEDS
jgi:O-antigen/teichoic acid export membrane protein